MWIVMTSAAKMPSACYGRYRNVALIQLTAEYTAKNLRPKFISERARGVLQVRHLGHHNVGLTDRCAYIRTLRDAERQADELNVT